MKRLLSLLLVATMLCGLFAGITVAAETPEPVAPIVINGKDGEKVGNVYTQFGDDYGMLGTKENGPDHAENGVIAYAFNAPVAGTYKLSLNYKCNNWCGDPEVRNVGVSVNGAAEIRYALNRADSAADIDLAEIVLKAGENTIQFANRTYNKNIWLYTITLTLVEEAAEPEATEAPAVPETPEVNIKIEAENPTDKYVDVSDNFKHNERELAEDGLHYENGAKTIIRFSSYDWYTYTITVPTNGIYKLSVMATSDRNNPFDYKLDNAESWTNANITANGGNWVYALHVLAESIELTAGTHTITFHNPNTANKNYTALTDYYVLELVEATEAPACQHTNTKVEGAVAATCTAAGHTGKTVCTDCNETINAGKEISALGHEMATEWTNDATNHWHKCTRCDHTDSVAVHTWKEGKCEICAYGCAHAATTLVGKKDATCTVAGYTGDEVCDACGHTVTKGEATATKAHAYTNGSCADCGAADPNYVPPHIIYVKPNANWNIGNARFAAYFFGNGELWVNCTDPDGDGIYEVEVPAKFEGKSVIFCRMNPGTTANNWDNKWNQTSDLTIPAADSSYNVYFVKENTWDGEGYWADKDGNKAPVVEVEPTYYVKGSFNDWGDANEMTKGDDGKWTCTIELKAGSHEYKINGSDGYWSPDPNIKLQLSADSIVIFTFDGSKVTTEIQPEATEPEATEPEATNPEATNPEATNPEATEPEATNPEATEPEATEPEATEPDATEPEATEPEATNPTVKIEVPFNVQNAATGGAAERSFTVTTAGTYKVIARVAKGWGSQHLLGVSVDDSEPKDYTIIKDDSMAYHDNELALVLELEEGEHVITLINNSDRNMHFEMVTLVLVEEAQPDATEPEATNPEATEPEATNPEATEPEATNPEATEPEATNPEATEPAVKVEVPFDVQYAGMGGAAERSFTITTGGTYKVIVRVAKGWGSKHLLGVSVDGSEPKDYTIIKDDSMAYHDNELDLVLELEEGEHVITLINNSDKNMHFATVTLVLVESSEPDATEPEATEPEATEPEATEPEATEPEATEPEATEPEFTLPEATEPEETKPAPETGDFVSAVMAMMAVSALGLAVVLRKKRF